MNYRTFYAQATGLPVPKTFDVHHIDEDRENNHIFNLVALPKVLHKQYHKSFAWVNQIGLGFSLTGFMLGRGSIVEGNIKEINDFYETYKQCCKWVDYRDFLLRRFDSNYWNLAYPEQPVVRWQRLRDEDYSRYPSNIQYYLEQQSKKAAV